MVLATVFPDVGAENIGITLNTLIILIGSAIVAIRQVLNGRSTWFGSRP